MKIALYRNTLDRDTKLADWTWDRFAEALLDHTETDCQPCPGHSCPAKNTTAFIPGWVDGSRLAANVRELYVLVFDFDNLPVSQVRGVVAKFEGLEALLYTSHSWGSTAAFRILLPLSKPVRGDEWAEFWQGAVNHFDVPADRACKDPSRLYFQPTHAKGAKFASTRSPGRWLNPDDIQRVAPPPRSLTVTPVVEAPEVDLSALGKALRKNVKSAKKPLAEAVLAGLPVGFAPGSPERAQGLPGRDEGLNLAASMLVWNTPRGTPVEALLELMRKSLSAMDCEPEGLAHWEDELTDMLERAIARRTLEDAKRVAEFAAQGAAQGLPAVTGREGGTQVPTVTEPPLAPSGAPAFSPPADGVGPYEGVMAELLIKETEHGPKLVNDPGNAKLILLSAPEWKNVIRYNKFTGDIEIHGGPLGYHGELKDIHVSEVRDWLARNPSKQYRLSLSTALVFEVLVQVAHRNAYDPMQNYFTSLKWDGVKRLDTWLMRYMGAVPEGFQGRDITAYLKAVGRKWLLSAVARVMSPGCKADGVLVLEGAQNAGKSTALRVLAGGGEYFTDTALDFGSKDAAQLTTTTWIIELAELESLRKSESTQAKAFLSKQEEKFRAPYARAMERHARRCVFAGSTNHNEYLNDPTGNRRYWPVAVSEPDINALREDRDQLWAEAYEAYRVGVNTPHLWWLTPEEYALAFAEAEERVATDDWASVVMGFWHKQGCPEVMTTGAVLIEGMALSLDKVNRASQMRAGQTLRSLGFERRRQRLNGVPTWVYVATPQMLAEARGVDVVGQQTLASAAELRL